MNQPTAWAMIVVLSWIVTQFCDSSELKPNVNLRITSIKSTVKLAATSQPPITYHRGPVMKSPVAYIIWYGNWNGNSGVTLIENFLKGLGASPWWGLVTAYNKTSNIAFGKSVYDSYSQGKSLTQSMVLAIVKKAVTSKALSTDSNGIYFVLTSADVTQTDFCTQACGWHDYDPTTKLVYSFVGNAAVKCPTACIEYKITPNGNMGADGMVSVIAHEAGEASTDPFENAWYDAAGEENGDKCAWQFGQQTKLSTGAYYNIVVGGTKYLIQQNWRLSSQSCAMS